MYLFIFIVLLFSRLSFAQIALLEIDLQKSSEGLDIPAEINLDQITLLPSDSISLIHIYGNKEIPVPFQIIEENPRKLCWLIKSEGEQKKVKYEIINKIPEKFDKIYTEKKNGSLIIRTKSKKLLSYFFKTVYPPQGVDSSYKRSGFIHPLWSPNGQILTRIQPPDHYHHYGIWNPWTHVLFENDTVDFWNIGDKKGTVRFSKFLSITNGNIFSEFKALHEHVVFKKTGNKKIALNEIQTVKIYKPEENQNYYFVDINIEMECAGESPVLLLKYRYGGLGWRTTEKWNKNNSEVLTSEGMTRKNADASKARWVIVQGEIDGDYAGAEMMSFPENYNFPEPLRIWPEDQNGRGDMFANFSPTRDKDWLLEPKKKYFLKYRFLVFNDHLSKEKAERAWEYFANPLNIKVTKFKN